jgi:hypothetical protein
MQEALEGGLLFSIDAGCQPVKLTGYLGAMLPCRPQVHLSKTARHYASSQCSR